MKSQNYGRSFSPSIFLVIVGAAIGTGLPSHGVSAETSVGADLIEARGGAAVDRIIYRAKNDGVNIVQLPKPAGGFTFTCDTQIRSIGPTYAYTKCFHKGSQRNRDCKNRNAFNFVSWSGGQCYCCWYRYK
jgi:hypothetical protein